MMDVNVTFWNAAGLLITLVMSGILGSLWFDIRGLKKRYMTKDNHDELCDLKLKPLYDDVAEMKEDVKELLRRNGGERAAE